MNKSLDYLKNLNINDYVILGLSGGPDSMALLDLLIKCKIKVICAHVNHNIRKESLEEYQFLEKYLKEKDIIFEGKTLEKGKHSEGYYRKKRYDFYKELADKYNTRYIMTAHHGDDLIETVLMRISRGTNLKGYAGFKKNYDEKKYNFIKPLIYVSKDEILKYVDENSIPYFIDETNKSNEYTRNRFRNNILPKLKEENNRINESFLKYSEELFEASDYIISLAKKELDNNYNGKYIDLIKFNKLDNIIKKYELNLIMSDLYQDDIDKVNNLHIDSILKKIDDNTNFELSLPLNIKCVREYNKLSFITKIDNEPFNIKFDKETKYKNWVIKEVKESDDNSNYITRLSFDDIKLPLYIRSKLDGDKMEVKNLNGYKKIKSIFIDEKIDPSKRNEVPILVDSDGKILWIPGIKKSKFDINKDEKYDIILKYERKE